MSTWKLAIGLFILSSVTVRSVAQEFVNDRDARKLLQLPANERGDFVAITDITFSPDGESIAIAATDGAVRILPIGEGSRPRVVAQGDSPVREIAFSPDGSLLAWATSRQVNLDLLVQVDEQQETDKPASLQGSECVAFSPDGQLLAIGNASGNATVIDRVKGESLFAIAPFAGTGPVDTGLYKPRTLAVSFSPDGNLLAVTTDFFDDELPYFRNLQVWDTKTGKLRFFFRGVSCGFSPGGDLLAYQSQMSEWDGRIVLLDIDTFLPVSVLTGQYQIASFAPDGRTIAAIARQQVELWTIPSQNGRSRTCSRTMVLRHSAGVTCLAFAPDGGSLTTGDAEGTIRVWDVVR